MRHTRTPTLTIRCPDAAASHDQHGFVLIAMLGVLIPLLVVVGAFATAAGGRSAVHRRDFDRERTLLAAESGIDEAIYRGELGTLVGGTGWTRDLGGGMSFTVEPTYLMTDGLDNDNDLAVDESDEDVFQVIVTGTYRTTTRRLAAYLGPVSPLPTFTAAAQLMNPFADISLSGTVQIFGNNTQINGMPGTGSVPAIQTESPGTVANLLSTLMPAEQLQVVGSGPTPSLNATTTGIDPVEIADLVQNTANVVLNASSYASANFGSGATAVANIVYRAGDVDFTGNTTAAGVMVVTGKLTVTGTFRFDGVLIVLGDIDDSAGTATIFGALVQGPAATNLTLTGTSRIVYSAEAIALAQSVTGRYVAFNGWQELAN